MIKSTAPLYKLIDVTLMIVACSLSYYLRFDISLIPSNYQILIIIHSFFIYLSMRTTGFYGDVNSQVNINSIKTCLAGSLLSLFILATLLYITKTGETFSRQWLMVNCLIASSFLLSYRVLISKLIGPNHSQKTIGILGNSSFWKNEDHARDFCKRSGLELAFYINKNIVDLDSVSRQIEKIRSAKDSKSALSEIWITSDIYEQQTSTDVESVFSDSAIRLVYLPTIPKGVSLSQDSVSFTNGLLTLNSTISKPHKLGSLLKTIEDKILSSLGLVFSFPILATIALAIKLDSKGTVFFKQNRYGAAGKEFKMWKFRTMIRNEADNEFQQATSNDPRVTRVGAFLRKTSLDELPQLINVVKGDMSIVGPRPHPIELNEEYRGLVNNYMKRHTIKPGITGLAQINGYRGELIKETDMENRVKLDLQYVNEWSLKLDFKIIIGTIKHLLNNNQAY